MPSGGANPYRDQDGTEDQSGNRKHLPEDEELRDEIEEYRHRYQNGDLRKGTTRCMCRRSWSAFRKLHRTEQT